MISRASYLYHVLRRQIVELPIYATNRCNSRCRTCHIWEKQPKQDLDPDVIRRVLADPAVARGTHFFLTGGEFLLHPRYEEILSLFRGRKYTLFSNGILAERLLEAVEKHRISSVALSLDGAPETYQVVRGLDNYANVEQVVRSLHHKINIIIGYNINPWNSPEDFLHVLEFCRRYKLRLSVGFYMGVEYYSTTGPEAPLYTVADHLHRPYVELYPNWATGALDLPCFTIFFRPVVMPNGDLNLCEAKEIKLGNLAEQSLSQIWNSSQTRQLQQSYLHCNACWLNCQRMKDITLTALLKSLVPGFLWRRHFPDRRGWDRLPSFPSLVRSYWHGVPARMG